MDGWVADVEEAVSGLLFSEVNSWQTGVNRNVEGRQVRRVLGTFDVRQVSGNATEVAYRSIYGGPDTDAGGGARNIADRCARP